MSWEELASCPEILECDLQTAYPGLPEHAYQSIAWESSHRHNGGSGGREWAFTTCKLAWLDFKRDKPDPAADDMDKDYFD